MGNCCDWFLSLVSLQVIETAPEPGSPPPAPAGPAVDEETLRKLDRDVRSLDKANLTLKKEVQQGFNGMSSSLGLVTPYLAMATV